MNVRVLASSHATAATGKRGEERRVQGFPRRNAKPTGCFGSTCANGEKAPGLELTYINLYYCSSLVPLSACVDLNTYTSAQNDICPRTRE